MPICVITGASTGLGFSIAEAFAKKKYDLLLVARGEAGLQKAAESLRAHGAKIDILAADLGAPEGVERVAAFLRTTPVDVLVNNAGFGNYGRFWELEGAGESDVLDLNIRAVVLLTRAALPGMISRGKGDVLNVASTAGLQPVPYFATYGATKAFVISFTEAVGAELRGSGVNGVNVAALCPGPMETGFQSRAGASKSTYGILPWETAESVAVQVVAAVGSRQSVFITAFFNRLLALSNRLSPRALVSWVGERMFRPKI